MLHCRSSENSLLISWLSTNYLDGTHTQTNIHYIFFFFLAQMLLLVDGFPTENKYCVCQFQRKVREKKTGVLCS